MDKVIESFIHQCDNMMITEESLISKIKEKKNANSLRKSTALVLISNYTGKKVQSMTKEEAKVYLTKIGSMSNYIPTHIMENGDFLNAINVLDLNENDIKKITSKENQTYKGEYTEYFTCDEPYEIIQGGAPNLNYEKINKELDTQDFRTLDSDGGGNTLVYSAKTGKIYDLYHEQLYTENMEKPISFVDFKKALKEIFSL